MGKGLNGVPDKLKRATRRRNHFARDLAEKKYRQRVVEDKRKKQKYPDYFDDDDYELIKKLGLTSKE
jgi:hypothetical protein